MESGGTGVRIQELRGREGNESRGEQALDKV